MAKKLTKYQQFMKKELKGNTGSKAQRKKKFKEAVAKWNRGKSSKGRAGSSNKTSSTKGRTGSTSGGQSRMGKKNGLTQQKIFKFVRWGALAAPAAAVAMESSTPKQKIVKGIRIYTGYSIAEKRFDFKWLAEGWMPYLGSVVTTVGIPKIISFLRSI